jgi:uncharacterized protein (DUF2062 family)
MTRDAADTWARSIARHTVTWRHDSCYDLGEILLLRPGEWEGARICYTLGCFGGIEFSRGLGPLLVPMFTCSSLPALVVGIFEWCTTVPYTYT